MRGGRRRGRSKLGQGTQEMGEVQEAVELCTIAFGDEGEHLFW